MSALPPKADMCSALAYVCFGPIADMRLFDDLIGCGEQRGRGESAGGGRSCYSYRTVQHHPGLQVVRRKFHDDTKRGGTCRQPAQAVI
jgi:hypothetical protein